MLLIDDCKSVGFNPVKKLFANEFLKIENKNNKSIKHKTNIHRDFPLDPKTRTTSLIFHYIPFNVTTHTHIYIHVEAFINPNPLTLD